MSGTLLKLMCVWILLLYRTSIERVRSGSGRTSCSGSVTTNSAGKCPNILLKISSGFMLTDVETQTWTVVSDFTELQHQHPLHLLTWQSVQIHVMWIWWHALINVKCQSFSLVTGLHTHNIITSFIKNLSVWVFMNDYMWTDFISRKWWNDLCVFFALIIFTMRSLAILLRNTNQITRWLKSSPKSTLFMTLRGVI